MRLEVLYKELSGNDSFETPEDRKSIYLDKLEKQYPGILCSLAQCMVVKTTDLDYEDEGFYTTEPIDINPIPRYRKVRNLISLVRFWFYNSAR